MVSLCQICPCNLAKLKGLSDLNLTACPSSRMISLSETTTLLYQYCRFLELLVYVRQAWCTHIDLPNYMFWILFHSSLQMVKKIYFCLLSLVPYRPLQWDTTDVETRVPCDLVTWVLSWCRRMLNVWFILGPLWLNYPGTTNGRKEANDIYSYDLNLSIQQRENLQFQPFVHTRIPITCEIFQYTHYWGFSKLVEHFFK